MLDKTAYKILGIIASMSSDGENLVVNKGEIISLVDVELSSDELDKIIEALELVTNDELKASRVKSDGSNHYKYTRDNM